jgi:hypothetical protein
VGAGIQFACGLLGRERRLMADSRIKKSKRIIRARFPIRLISNHIILLLFLYILIKLSPFPLPLPCTAATDIRDTRQGPSNPLSNTEQVFRQGMQTTKHLRTVVSKRGVHRFQRFCRA